MRKLKSPKNVSLSFFCFGIALISLSLNQFIAPYTIQKQQTRWTPPQSIPGFDPEAWPPILVADQSGIVHAFSSQWIPVDGDTSIKAIVYNRWTVDDGWTEPIDILLSPIKEARITDVILDDSGLFHLVFWGGDNTASDIYYSQARIDVVGNANMWAPPVLIGENAGDPESAVISEDQNGNLITAYHGAEYGNGIYITHSEDGGNNWSEPEVIFNVSENAPLIYNIHVARSGPGLFHLIWNTLTVASQGRAIFYAKSTDGGMGWSDPIQLAEVEDGFGVLMPSIIEYNKTLFVLYYYTPKIIMRRSFNDGKEWDNPTTIFQRHVGVNGSLSLVVDSDENLHLFFGQRIPGNGTPDLHGMWHSVFENNRWSEPEAVVKGPLVKDEVGNKAFDPFEARSVIVQGNIVLVTWRSEGTSKGNGVWYSYKLLDSKRIPAIPIPSLVSQGIKNPNDEPSVTPTPLSSPGLSPVDIVNIKLLPAANQNKLKPGDFVIISGALSIIFILIVIILQKRNRN